MRRQLFLTLSLLAIIVALAACGGGAAPEPAPPEEVEVEVTREVQVSVVVEGTPQVFTTVETETVVVTATPAPVAEGPKTMVICMAQEPNTLIWSESALVTSAVLEAVQEPVFDTREYGYQANLVEKLPSFDDGDAVLEEVTVKEGDRFYDVLSDEVLTLTSGMTETFQLNQLEGDPVEVAGYAGEELTTVQVTAEWTLVEGLTWEDGTPVTADDSVFGFEINNDPAYPGSHYTADRTSSYTAVDDRTLEWKGLPGFTDSTYFINVWTPRPRHVLGEMSWVEIQEDEAANRDPVGYGAYMVDEWIAQDSITLSPNPNYFRGAPPLDQLIYRFVPDTNQLVAQLASGQCDMGTQDAAFEGSLPLIRGFEEQGLLEVLDVAGTVFEHLDFNTLPVDSYTGAAATLTDNEGGRLFANPLFHHAIAHCIDRDDIVARATNGAGFVQHTYTAADHPLYPGDDAITIYEFDPAAGLEILAGLGWSDTDGDTILDKDGQKLSFVHSTRQNPLRERVTQIVQE
ncbi:MAG: ABC transporter substrate-binding protein, partial [Ardenticatenaceae bacterium]